MGPMTEPPMTPPQAQGQPPQQAQPAMSGDMPDGDDGEAATPEEQAIYDRFVTTVMGVIYPEGPEQVSPAIMQNLQGQFDERAQGMFAEAQPSVQQTPTDSIAQTGVLLTIAVESAMERSGQQIPDDVVFHAGAEVMEMLIELAEVAGFVDLSEEEMQAVLLRAMDLYRIASPRVDPEALSAEFGQIIEADKAGQLDKILPGATSFKGFGEQGEAEMEQEEPGEMPEEEED